MHAVHPYPAIAYLSFFGSRSKLRSLHESLNEPKYAGQKIKRQLGEDVSSDDEEKQEEPEQSSGSSAHSEEERDRASQSDHDSDMEDTKEKEDTEELNNVLKKAKESDQAKGRAISKQMVGYALLHLGQRFDHAPIGDLGYSSRRSYPVAKVFFSL